MRPEAPLFARQPSAQRPSRLVVLPCRRWATRSAIAAHGPSPGRAALAPRRRARPSSLPAGRRPESPHLRARCSGGADLERARGGRRGGACAAARVRPVHARPHVRGSVREVAWLPGRLGRLNSSRTRRLPSELKVQIGTSLVAGARRHGGAVGHRRELSDPGIRARLAGAALQSERANSHICCAHARTEIAPRNDVRPRTADYENETYAVRRNRSGNSCGVSTQFCCVVRINTQERRGHPPHLSVTICLCRVNHGPSASRT